MVWEGTVTSQNDIQIRDFDFIVQASDIAGSAEANFQNFRLVNKATGLTVAGPEEFDDAFASLSDSTNEAVSFVDDWNMSAGQSLDLQLLVDVKGASGNYSVSAGETIYATWDASGIAARDSNNDDLTVGTDIVPNADLQGFTHEAVLASITTALSQPPSSNTFVKGAQNVDMVGISFAAGTASAIKVSATTLNAYGDDDGGNPATFDLAADTYFTSCTLYDGITGAIIDGPESFGTADGGVVTGTDRDIVFSGFSSSAAP